MTSPISYDVFISHNGLDKPWVRTFVKYLRVCGLQVFFDEDSIDYGADIVTSLDAAIERSAHVLLVISPSSLTSRWVALESSISVYSDPSAQAKKIIPILLTAVPRDQITPSIRRLNHVDLTRDDNREEVLHRLLRQLGIPEEKISLSALSVLVTENVNQKPSESIYRFCQPAQEWYIPRKEEELIREILTALEQLHRNVVITGRTGFGKSSFLTWLEREAAAQGHVVIKLRSSSDQLGEFYETLKQHCLDQIEVLDVGAPVLKGVYSVDMDAVLNRLTTKTSKRLIILIDQLENLLPYASNVAAAVVWRSITTTLASQLRNPRIVWVFAVKEWYFLALFPSELNLKLIDATYISLSDLDHVQSTELVRRLASLTNVAISNPAIDLLVTKTGGRPLTLVLAFLVATEKSPKHLIIEYDYLDETQPWNEIFKADYDRLESHRQRLIVLALAHTRRELVSQAEIVSKVAQADGCSISDVEADLKRIDNEIGIITLNEGFVSFVHSAFGLYVDSKHYDEYPKTWSQQSATDHEQSRDLEVISADITQRTISLIVHNLGTRFASGPFLIHRLKETLAKENLKKAEGVVEELERWLNGVFSVLKRTSTSFAPYRLDEEAILADAIYAVTERFQRDSILISVLGISSIGRSRVEGSKEIVEHVFSQLFQNSVEANATDIVVRLEKDPESPLINCDIEDNGSGIPEEKRQRIFDAFYSAGGGHTHLGLGLFVVKHMLQSCGGTIDLVASGPTGTHFTLRFVLSENLEIDVD